MWPSQRLWQMLPENCYKPLPFSHCNEEGWNHPRRTQNGQQFMTGLSLLFPKTAGHMKWAILADASKGLQMGFSCSDCLEAIVNYGKFLNSFINSCFSKPTADQSFFSIVKKPFLGYIKSCELWHFCSKKIREALNIVLLHMVFLMFFVSEQWTSDSWAGMYLCPLALMIHTYRDTKKKRDSNHQASFKLWSSTCV